MTEIVALKEKLDQYDSVLNDHKELLEKHNQQLSDMGKHAHDTNRSLVVMNETIALINTQVNQNLRDTVRNTSFLDEVREITRALEEDSIARRADKDYVVRQRSTISDMLTIAQKTFTILAFLIVSALAVFGIVQPETLMKHLAF